MTQEDFGARFIEDLVGRCEARLDLGEVPGTDRGPRMRLHDPEDPTLARGFVRLWRGTLPVDRMAHVRLAAENADTHLFFLFGSPRTAQPHFHGQVVQFGADACVYNADLIPRLDGIDHPEYFEAVFGPITKAYWRAIQKPQRACAGAPANPAIATYLSPWSIGAGRPATRAELEEVGPQIHAYLEHWLDLTETLDYAGPPARELAARDQRHMDGFFSERLDPRAWKGVYRLVGQEQGAEIRRILMQTLSE